ncbi:hypothetical protein [Pseudomonas schmalbachii]|uniref:Type 1 fimbrial protein n=1 Tax=Pseudomonas schmalbachii TaxID=2816993 RepID=A0ABS3TP65_9PSED|nr:hypothetical protein [Pseudomonas schmalbachii]MBO3275448.1 hypothetical protein [Pseudomonas schmalbachii]
MNKNKILGSLLLLVGSANAADMAGTITFRGSIVEPPCSTGIVSTSASQPRVQLSECSVPLQVGLTDPHRPGSPVRASITDMQGRPVAELQDVSRMPYGEQLLQVRKQAGSQMPKALTVNLTYL